MLKKEDMQRNVSSAIALFMAREGMSVRDVATCSGLPYTAVKRYIDREGQPTLYSAYLLADVMGLTVDQLIRGDKK